MSRKCQNCGTEIADNMNFCPKCHAKVETVAEQPVASGPAGSAEQGPSAEPIRAQNSERPHSPAALIIGIINCIMWLLPIIGVPLGIVGLIIACRQKYRKAIILNAVTLGLAIVNGIAGIVLFLSR